MKISRFIGGIAIGCAGTLLATATLAAALRQDPPQQMDPMQQAWQEAMQKFGVPAEQHAILARMEGAWDCKIEMWMAPGGEPDVAQGEANFAMIMGGRYLFQDFRSSFEGEDFEGGGLTGYDRMKNKYVAMWIDSMSTAIMTAEGEAKEGAAGHVVEYSGQMPDPMRGEYVKTRSVETLSEDGNTFTVEMYGPDENDNEYMSMRLTYTRQGE